MNAATYDEVANNPESDCLITYARMCELCEAHGLDSADYIAEHSLELVYVAADVLRWLGY